MTASFNLNSRFFLEKYDFIHVSLEVGGSNSFYPRVPESRSSQEDSSTKRVCVARNLEGALTAIPGGSAGLGSSLADYSNVLKVYGISCEKLGITPADIISDTTLYEKDMVEDAYWTEECWITKSFVVPDEDIYHITIGYWDEAESDQVPYIVRYLADEKYGGNLGEAWDELYDGKMPSIQVIENVYFSLIGHCSENLFIVNEDNIIEWSEGLQGCEAIQSFYVENHSFDVMHTTMPYQKLVTIQIKPQEELNVAMIAAYEKQIIQLA
ncbi:hypothetical protein [Lysinibacillus sphaericus]|uniref:hypothetical protein n=1 Tax=Lysinibacillus sphaericus TaxID=1421 RepID=UPI0018CFA81C|nr:hypothetical protein [Lysinibacillus sphaericus]